MQRKHWWRLAGLAALGLGIGLLTVLLLGVAMHNRGAEAFAAEAARGPAVPPACDPDDPGLRAWATAVQNLLPANDPVQLGGVFSCPTKAEGIAFNLWLEIGSGTPKPVIALFWASHRDAARQMADLLARAGRNPGGGGASSPALNLGLLPVPGEGSVPVAQRRVVDVALVLQLGARIEDDPGPWLDAFDGLSAAMQPVHTRLQGMLAIEIARLRDQAYLTAALRGRLDAARAARWSAEPADQRLWLAAGLDGERALVAIPTLRPQVDGSLAHGLWSVRDGGSLWTRWKTWCNFPAVATAVITAQRECAAGLRGDVAWTWDTRDAPGAAGRSGLFDLSNTALTAETFHRLARLGAAVVAWQRQHGALPPDGTALAVIAPDLGGDHPGQLRLRYQLLTPGRFRISIDPDGPLPAFADAQRYAPRTWEFDLQGLYHYAVELDFPVPP